MPVTKYPIGLSVCQSPKYPIVLSMCQSHRYPIGLSVRQSHRYPVGVSAYQSHRYPVGVFVCQSHKILCLCLCANHVDTLLVFSSISLSAQLTVLQSVSLLACLLAVRANPVGWLCTCVCVFMVNYVSACRGQLCLCLLRLTMLPNELVAGPHDQQLCLQPSPRREQLFFC